MKKKSSSKTTPKNAPAPPPAAYLVKHGKIKEGDPIPQYEYPPPLPTILEMAVRKFFPEVEGDAPEWAKQAAKMAFKSAMPPERKKNASKKYLEGFASGKFSAAEELLPVDMLPTSPSKYGGLTDIELASELPSDQRADFFCGFRDGEKRVREMPERAKAAQRVKVFRAIAANWREVKKFESSSQLHDWLLEKGAIVSGTDSRETRKVCKMIELEFQNKWRKQKA